MELIAVISILAILATLFFSLQPVIYRSFERAKCISNLKSLYFSLSSALNDTGHWPQLPANVSIDSEEEDAWWRKTLKPYEMSEKNWHCPTLIRTAKERNMERALRSNHYVPSLFDSKPLTPMRWSGMPWAMEIGNNHQSGLLIVDNAGTVMTYDEFQKTAR